MIKTSRVDTNKVVNAGNVVDFLVSYHGLQDRKQSKRPCQNEALRIATNIMRRSKPKDIDFVKALEIAINNDLKSESIENIRFASLISLECAIYFQNIDNLDRALERCYISLEWALVLKDEALQRRSYGMLGSTYVRLSDFEKAFKNLEQAYYLAVKLKDGVAMFATLANTVAVLETMGLFDEARRLALDLSLTQPWGEDRLEVLHLCNANNGLRMSQQLNDDEAAKKFYEVAKRAFKASATFADEITIAHFKAAEIVYFVKNGRLESADDLAAAALKANAITCNIQVQSLLICAQAVLHVATKSIPKIESSCIEAQRMLSITENSSDHYEELIRTLIMLHDALERLTAKGCTSKVDVYRHSLRRHILSVKHRHYFTNVVRDLAKWSEQNGFLSAPRYIVPGWLLEASGLCGNANNLSSYLTQNSLEVTPKEIEEFRNYNEIVGLKSAHYHIAENWAIAAEVTLGGRGQHCFLVGLVAAAVAREMNFSKLDVERIELACRLHDIGTIAGNIWRLPSNQLRALGKLSMFCEHPAFGERLLHASSDETLRLAARIARSHHEWWNGCGYPDGLSKDNIPIESRLCAVADVFVSLIVPMRGNVAWNVMQAISQIKTMSGMQLDPQVVTAFAKVFRDSVRVERLISQLQNSHEDQMSTTVFPSLEVFA